VTVQRLAQRVVQCVGEFGARLASGHRQCANDHRTAHCKHIHPSSHEVAKPSFHAVARDRWPDALADDEPHRDRGYVGVVQMQDHRPRRCAPAVSHRPAEVVAGSHPCGCRQHEPDASTELRRPASLDPCDDGSRGSNARRGYASGAGSHASCSGDGCSAGTCACSQTCSMLEKMRLGQSPPAHVACGRRRRQSDCPTVRRLQRQGQTGACLWTTHCCHPTPLLASGVP